MSINSTEIRKVHPVPAEMHILRLANHRNSLIRLQMLRRLLVGSSGGFVIMIMCEYRMRI